MGERMDYLAEFIKNIPDSIKAEGIWVSFARNHDGWDVFLYDTEYSDKLPRYTFVLHKGHLGEMLSALPGQGLSARVLSEYEIEDYLEHGQMPERWGIK